MVPPVNALRRALRGRNPLRELHGVKGLDPLFVPDKASPDASAEAYMYTPHKRARVQRSQGQKAYPERKSKGTPWAKPKGSS
jgi:hypothetical protein